MKTGFRLLSILLLIITTFNTINGQSNEKLSKKEAKVMEEQADLNYEDKNYLDALNQFTQLYNYKPDDLYYKLMMGICLTYDPVQKHKSIEIIEQVKLVNPEYNLVNFYLGRAYAVNYEFDKGTEYFNNFLSRATNEDEDQKILAVQMIENCRNAKEILADTIAENIVENLSATVNSEYSEYVPVISADETVMIFTYRGIKSVGSEDVKDAVGSDKYNEDVFITYKKDGKWSEPKSIGENINTKEHDAAIALSVDGQTLFVYKTDGGGDIYVSYLSGDDWSRPRPVEGDVNKKDSWEGSCSLSADGKVLYFASNRDGGFGGRDIYKAELQEDETWGNVQNLGKNINTVYNEDAPFIHPDNQTLYFSSQGHTSVGGYDVFSSTKDENGIFGEPVNLGYPINTIDDNKYFVLAANGETGYYSGDGRTSVGGQDIFKIKTGKIGKPVMALLKGVVYFDDVPTGAKLIMYQTTENELEGSFSANSDSGKYTLALSVGTHKVKVELETGKALQQKDLDAKYFGEGITIFNNKIHQLTWQGGIGIVYDLETFEKEKEFKYTKSLQGWGLANDGKHLLKTDGTERIWFLNSETFVEESYIEAYTNKRKVENLNELEYINGLIYANIWQQNSILIINPKTGKVEGVADLDGLKKEILKAYYCLYFFFQLH